MKDSSLECLLGRPLVFEDTIEPHELDRNPEALLFRSTGPGATELEYLELLSALVGVFKPTCVIETGTLSGDGSVALMYRMNVGASLVTIGSDELSPSDKNRLIMVASACRVRFHHIREHTSKLLIAGNAALARATDGKATFAFLDSSIPDRFRELAYIADPRNGIMDLSRPCCVCIHDFSKHRPPNAHDSRYQAEVAESIECWSRTNGWEWLRFHQSRGMYVLARYPS